MKRVEKLEIAVNETAWKPCTDGFLLDCRVRNLTHKTIEGYAQCLTYLVQWCQSHRVGINDVTTSHLQKYVMSIVGTVSDATVNGRIRVFKVFFAYLQRDGFIQQENPAGKLRLIRQEKIIRPIVTSEQMEQVLRAIDRKTFVGCRNFALMLVLWDGMVRKSELISLKSENVVIKNCLVRVYGKGRKERWVPIGFKTARALNLYIHQWRHACPGDHLFCLRNGRPISEWHCHRIVRRIGERVGIKLYPHLIRHSAATHFITNGGSLAVLQQILGHTSPIVTENYLHLNGEHLRRTYETRSPSDALDL